METKKCTNCTRAPQPLSEFLSRWGNPCTTCKKCREKGKIHDSKPERLEKHKELSKQKGAEYSRLSRSRDRVKEHNMEQTCNWAKSDKSRSRVSKWKKTNLTEKLGHAKRSAIARGHDWYLSDEYAKELLNQSCHYCGFINLEETCNGIDRMDNSKCYIPSNCVACCKDCNYAKHTLDYDQFISLCKRIAARFA